MATLQEVKAAIVSLETQQATLLAERLDLIEQAGDLQRQAHAKLVAYQEADMQLSVLKAQLFDGFTAGLAAAPGAVTYAEVGAAMDAAADSEES